MKDEVLDLISLEDVVEAILEGKEFMIAEITRYVTGSPIADIEVPKRDNVRELVFIRSKQYGASPATA